jgi:hypothetical protein
MKEQPDGPASKDYPPMTMHLRAVPPVPGEPLSWRLLADRAGWAMSHLPRCILCTRRELEALRAAVSGDTKRMPSRRQAAVARLDRECVASFSFAGTKGRYPVIGLAAAGAFCAGANRPRLNSEACNYAGTCCVSDRRSARSAGRAGRSDVQNLSRHYRGHTATLTQSQQTTASAGRRRAGIGLPT